MRQHKYRYWYSGKMEEVGQIDFFENGTYRVNDELVGGVLMEFTGLKDKNGKEIYEGDIVNIDGLIVPVIWYAGAWMVEYFTIPTKSYLSHFDELDVEIIGNIYENTEILSGN